MKTLLAICLLLTGMVGKAQTTVTVTLFDETFNGDQINYTNNLFLRTDLSPVYSFNNGFVFGSQDTTKYADIEVRIPVSIQANKQNIQLHLTYDNTGTLTYIANGQYNPIKPTISYGELTPVGIVVTTLSGKKMSRLTEVKVTYDSTYTDNPPTGIFENTIPDLNVFSYENKISLNCTGDLTVNVFNHLGQSIYSTKVSGKNEIEVPLSGVYFVYITDGQNRKFNKKLYLSN